MGNIKKAVDVIREENLSGWLFYNVHHRDKIADLFLNIPEERINTRPWIYAVPVRGKPLKLVHAIEASILDELPGRKIVYNSRQKFLEGLDELKEAGTDYAVQYSTWNPEISFMDHGVAELLKSTGFNIVSSENLILKTLGVLDDSGISSHQNAAEILYSSVNTVWNKIFNMFLRERDVKEGDIQGWFSEILKEENMISDSPPIVASGKNSGDPHYMPKNGGAVLKRDTVVQFDIWAKFDTKNAVYADISWVGYLGEKIPPEMEKLFSTVKRARDETVNFISEKISAGMPVSGADADRKEREVLTAGGYSDYIKHRTGHSIGTEVHGFGINLDSIEFPDERNLINGSCFSVEPGLYLPEYGMRTEIDVYIKKEKVVISGSKPQENLLHF
ncbi:MAG: aminopeptidase P family protein [Spirochaetales bacterium]|nr:aminopeptidase P family protein [Spirochaetales bacterium]